MTDGFHAVAVVKPPAQTNSRLVFHIHRVRPQQVVGSISEDSFALVPSSVQMCKSIMCHLNNVGVQCAAWAMHPIIWIMFAHHRLSCPLMTANLQGVRDRKSVV